MGESVGKIKKILEIEEDLHMGMQIKEKQHLFNHFKVKVIV
jgi:hypothetical protein